MNSNIIFLYDGQCPFCNHFASLLELKSNIPNIQIRDARNNPHDLPEGYDMDIKGAVLYKDGEFLHGAKAINWICKQINNPSDSLLRLVSRTFSSKARTDLIFPLLIIARRFALSLKRVPNKIIY